MTEKFWDADTLEDHNTFDMGSTTFGAPLMQELYNPSLHFRRFPPGQARGVANKTYLPATFSSLTLRFCSRVRASDDPVVPVTPGNMWLWIGLRDTPDFQWRFHKMLQAHPSQGITNWQEWTITLPYVPTLFNLNLVPPKFIQLSIVRRADDPTDTATDTNWDVMGINVEIT